jgi:acyl-CoA synthetase (AMP-forming)/AMP-acid ligase II
MNCVAAFLAHVRATPRRPALWVDGELVTFGELASLAARAQALCRRHGLRAGDAVMILDGLGARLYAFVIAVLGLGGTVVLVEPSMPVAAVAHAVTAVRPHLFVGGWLARLWGARVGAIRDIAHWVHPARLHLEFGGRPTVESVDEGTPGTITFTTGTTGLPKGVVRTHGSLVAQVRVLNRAFDSADDVAPDLCVFPAFAMLNLASGRPSVLVARPFDRRALAAVDALPPDLRPRSVACGPAVLRQLLDATRALALGSVHVGGAPMDWTLLRDVYARWPTATVKHVYGSTEAEPVALADGRAALDRTRARGLWQVLYLGRPAPEVEVAIDADGVWVHGPHVAPSYLGAGKRARALRRADAAGRLWHGMGDRARDDDGLWYGGRTAQPAEDFALEQERIYPFVGHSNCFVHRTADGRRILVGEAVAAHAAALRARCPELAEVVEAPLVRDRRHRARIDRVGSVPRRPWSRSYR